MKKICIDARNIRAGMSGLCRYALHIVKGIAEIDKEKEIIQAEMVKRKVEIKAEAEKFQVVVSEIPAYERPAPSSIAEASIWT